MFLLENICCAQFRKRTLALNFSTPTSRARNEIEQRIVSLWETLLGITPVEINDNFFELGGNLLTGIDLIASLRKMFQLETLAAHVLYEAPTVSKIALYLESGKSDQQEVRERLERGEKRRKARNDMHMNSRREASQVFG